MPVFCSASGASLGVTEGVVGQTEEDSSNLDDFYDPEDIEAANDIEVSDLSDGYYEEEPFEPLLKYGIQRDELEEFRMGGCTRKSILKKLPIFTARSAAPLTRTLSFFTGSVLGFGSGNYKDIREKQLELLWEIDGEVRFV